METKTLKNTDQDAAKKNVSDLVVFGGDLFKLLSKASSEKEGWMKSTKAMEIPGVGCVVQVTTQQINETGVEAVEFSPSEEEEGNTFWNFQGRQANNYSLAEAVTFVPGVRIEEDKDEEGKVTGRSLVKM